MKSTSVEAIVQVLTDSEVRYLIVGRLAVVAHGYVRFTAGLDLVLALDDANLRKAVAALSTLEYRPRAPVGFSAFVDPQMRAAWVREKGGWCSFHSTVPVTRSRRSTSSWRHR